MNGKETKSYQSSSEPNESVMRGISRRRDCIAIKNELLKKINAEDYLSTLNTFFQGNCSKDQFDDKMREILPTQKTRILHNILMSSIIFNAHFSISPPSNTNCPTSHSLDDPKLVNFENIDINDDNNSMKSLEDYHLPSIKQLNSRIKTIVSEMEIDSVEIKAVDLIYKSVLSFVMLILYNSIEHTKEDSVNNEDKEKDEDEDENQNENEIENANYSIIQNNLQPLSISFPLVMHTIESNHLFLDIADKEVLSKYKLFIERHKKE